MTAYLRSVDNHGISVIISEPEALLLISVPAPAAAIASLYLPMTAEH